MTTTEAAVAPTVRKVHKFLVCPNCGSHGRFVDNDETIEDRVVVFSKQAAQDRLKVMQDNDHISDEDAAKAVEAINASGLPDEITELDRSYRPSPISEVALLALLLGL